jgi:hypothetical protein
VQLAAAEVRRAARSTCRESSSPKLDRDHWIDEPHLHVTALQLRHLDRAEGFDDPAFDVGSVLTQNRRLVRASAARAYLATLGALEHVLVPTRRLMALLAEPAEKAAAP